MLKTARLFAVVALGSAILTLFGYATGTYSLTTLRAGFQGMSILTALTLMALSASVLAATWRLRRVRIYAAAAAAVLFFPVLLSHLMAGKDVINPFLATQLLSIPSTAAGHTSLGTTCAALLIALSLGWRSSRPRSADMCAGAAGVVALTALIGYAYGVDDLYAMALFNTMALHTAICLLLLAIASIVSSSAPGWSQAIASHSEGGHATRRQLGLLLLPVVVGWILVDAVHRETIGFAAAMALLVLTTVCPLAFLILRDGRRLVELDETRRASTASELRQRGEMEGRLAMQANELEQAAAARSSAEAAMHSAQRMETVGQLTGGIAHDFNNLLMAISGNLQLLRRKLPKEAPEQRYVANAIVATDKGTKVTGQLLAFSRSQRLSITATHIQPVIANALTMIRNAIGPGIRVHSEVATRPLWAMTDADQLELALLNLAVNARDAMPEGGVFELRCDQFNDDAEGECVSVRVSDTGSGMSRDILNRAVEPFFTTKERGKGTGLGLAQVFGFARQCQGDLRITSELGKGTTVQILLPSTLPAEQLRPEGSPIAAASAHVDVNRGARKVLVIDDDDAVREVLVSALEDAGFEVRSAADGPAGLALMHQFDPAVAVIDFLMPGMNGAEVARAAQLQRPDLPVVFVSGYSDTLALEGITKAVVLRKPFEVEDLSRAIAVAMEGSPRMRESFSDSNLSA